MVPLGAVKRLKGLGYKFNSNQVSFANHFHCFRQSEQCEKVYFGFKTNNRFNETQSVISSKLKLVRDDTNASQSHDVRLRAI